MPKTPLRALRVSDDLWRAAQARAKECGETVSEVVRRALVAYADDTAGARPATIAAADGSPVPDSTFLLAQGMMMQRLGLDVTEAAAYLHRRSEARGTSLAETAREVVDERISAQSEASRV